MLKKIDLLCSAADERSTARMSLFSWAAGTNPSMKLIDLSGSHVPVKSFATLMRTTASLEELKLLGVSFVPEATQIDGASVDEQFTVAFASNRTLMKLALSTSESQLFSQSVMEALSQHPTLEHLLVSCSSFDNTICMQENLVASFALVEAIFRRSLFKESDGGKMNSQTVASSLQQNTTVKEMFLESAKFLDSQSAEDLCSI